MLLGLDHVLFGYKAKYTRNIALFWCSWVEIHSDINSVILYSLRNRFEMFKMQESIWLRPCEYVIDKEERSWVGTKTWWSSQALTGWGGGQGGWEASLGHCLCKLRLGQCSWCGQGEWRRHPDNGEGIWMSEGLHPCRIWKVYSF